MAEFQVGDVVRLKCGGPSLAVASIRHELREPAVVLCVWISPDGVPHEGAFLADCLEPAYAELKGTA